MISNSIPLEVDGVDYEVTIQDYGTHWKVRVYRNEKVIGVKDYPFRIHLGMGVYTHLIRSIEKGQNASAN